MKPGVSDEKLALVSVSPAIGHRKQAPPVVLKSVGKLILEWLVVNALASFASACGVPSLNDEA